MARPLGTAPAERQQATETCHFFYRHPGLDSGSITAALKEWIPDQVRDDEWRLTTDCGRCAILGSRHNRIKATDASVATEKRYDVTMTQWTFFIPFLWILGFVAVSIWYRRWKDEPIFPRLPDDAEFGEKGCSGRSLKSPLSKIGGASRCLLVAVRKGKLIITPQFPFNLMFLPEIYGLDIKVPVGTIASVKPVSSLFQKALRIEFTPGGPAPVEVVLHDEKGFERAIGSRVAAPGNRELKANSGLRKNRTFLFARAFFAVWGAGALFAAVTGLQDDQRFRRDGIATMATYVNPDQALDGQIKMGVLQYEVDGAVYRVNSIYGTGLFEVGEQERVYYLRSNPQEARQDSYSNFNMLWLVLGAIGLSVSIFGGMVAKRIW